MFRHGVVVRVGLDEIFDRHPMLLAIIEIIFGHLLPAFGFSAAYGNNEGAFYPRRLEQRGVLFGDLRRHGYLPLRTVFPHHAALIDARGTGRAFDQVSPPSFFRPRAPACHSAEMAS